MRSRLLLTLLLGFPALGQQRVLLIDLDDLGWDLVASTETPTLDRLAAEGRRFTRFHVTPVCSPSRARLLLGAYGSHPDVLCGATIKGNGIWKLPLEPLVPLPRLIGEHGYRTAKIGKWHLAPKSHFNHPTLAGWDLYAGVLGNLQGEPDGYFEYGKVVNGTLGLHDVYLTTDETEDALRCVEAGIDLVSVSYHAIHIPFHVPPPEVYQGPPPTSDLEQLHAMLQALDHELGRLIEGALAASYTVIVFSDNGTSNQVGGGKEHLTPAGVIVPMWAIGPGVTPGTDEGWVDIVDVYATVADLLGVPRNEPTLQGPHSVSFARRLAGEAGPARQLAYSEHWLPNGKDPHDLSPNQKWRRSLRSDEWSIVVNDEDDEPLHFYDRVVDAREQVDLLVRGLDAVSRAAAERFWELLQSW